MEDFSKLENNNNTIVIDNKINSVIRTYKQGDNILYSYGINNLILGLVKISSISSENENEDKDNFNYEIFKKSIPIGMYINGVIAINNENTYEDFESILQEQCEKIKELQPDKNDNYIQLALKELLYLDDYEDLSFEFKKFKDVTDDLEIVFIEDVIEKSELYSFFVNRVNIYFNSDKKDNLLDIESTDDIKKKFETNDIICNISDLENKQEFMVDNIKSLTSENSEHITKFLNKIHISQSNDLNLKSIFIQIGIKQLLLNNINIKDISIKLEENETYDLYIETIGLISKKENNYNTIITELFNRSLENIQNFLSSLQSNTQLSHNILIYNKLYSSIPHQITSLTKFKNESNKITLEKISQLENELFIRKTLHIKGIVIFKLNPITENQELKEEGKHYSIHLKSPHLTLTTPISSSHIIRACIKGDYLYYHYNQDNINDAGWGCAYRSLQTLFSWFILNTSIGKGKKVPSINDIQLTLVKLGDKDKSLIGSNGWIGAVEVNLVLNELLGIESQIIFCPSGKDISSKGRELIYHFQNNGTPVMIGGGVFAYTILGVDYDIVKGDCMFLILDPHYSGEDDVKTITSKGFCNWKSIDLFKKESFYNMCLPMIN